MITKILDIYVKLIAILAVVIAAGLISVYPRIKTEVLKPAYVIGLSELQSFCKTWNSGNPDRFIEILQDSTAPLYLVIDRPTIDTNTFNKQRMATDGTQIFNCVMFVTSGEIMVSQMLGLGFSEESMRLEPLHTPEDKRVALACAFDHFEGLITVGKSTRELKSDSLLKLVKIADGDMLFSLFAARLVYNFLSIENLSDYEVTDIMLRISEPRYLLSTSKLIGLSAWTLPECGFATARKEGGQIEFRLPSLRPRKSVQLLVMTSSTNIGEADVHLSYNKLGNLDKQLILFLLLGVLGISVLIYIRESTIFARNSNH